MRPIPLGHHRWRTAHRGSLHGLPRRKAVFPLSYLNDRPFSSSALCGRAARHRFRPIGGGRAALPHSPISRKGSASSRRNVLLDLALKTTDLSPPAVDGPVSAKRFGYFMVARKPIESGGCSSDVLVQGGSSKAKVGKAEKQ